MLCVPKQIVVWLLAAANIKNLWDVSPDALKSGDRGPFEIRPKIFIVQVIFFPDSQNPQTAALKPA
jgi:hypothetical protein